MNASREAIGDPEAPPLTADQGISTFAFGLLFFALMSNGFGQSIVFSMLPPIIRELGLRDSSVALIHAIPAIIWAITSPMWGRTSDRWGRRPVIFIGVFGWGISAALFALSIQLGLMGLIALGPVYVIMIASRSLFGLTTSGVMPAANAYVAERTTRADRTAAMATLGAANGIGNMTGPAVGAVLVVFGLVAPFYATAVVSVLGALAVLYFLPEGSKHAQPSQAVEPRPWLNPRDKRILPFLINGFSNAFTQSAAMSTIGFYFADILNLSSEQTVRLVGWALMAHAVAALCTQLIFIRLFKPSARVLLTVGPALILLSFCILIVSSNLTMLMTSLVILGLGLGLFWPGCTSGLSLSVNDTELGTANGMVGSSFAIGFAVGPIVAAPFYEVWHPGPYVLGLAMMTVVLINGLSSPVIRGLGHGTRHNPPPATQD